MPTYDHQARHASRLEALLRHIDRHLDQSLPLAELARQSHLSPYHLHRLFSTWAGENPADYLGRRRLAYAAVLLSCKVEMSVLQVALEVGFGSAEAFARAFKRQYGQSPSAWRKQQVSNLDQAGGLVQVHACASEVPGPWLETRAPQRVACRRHIGPYSDVFGGFWQDAMANWLSEYGLPNGDFYGVGHDDPQLTEPARVRYDACVALSVDWLLPEQVAEQWLAGGQYAVSHFRGTAQQLPGAWRTLYREGLPALAVDFAMGPCFERYDALPDHSGELQCRLYIPVKPR